MPPVAARYVPYGDRYVLPCGKTRLGYDRVSRIAALVARSATYRLLALRANIEFRACEKYIEFAIGEHIDKNKGESQNDG